MLCTLPLGRLKITGMMSRKLAALWLLSWGILGGMGFCCRRSRLYRWLRRCMLLIWWLGGMLRLGFVIITDIEWNINVDFRILELIKNPPPSTPRHLRHHLRTNFPHQLPSRQTPSHLRPLPHLHHPLHNFHSSHHSRHRRGCLSWKNWYHFQKRHEPNFRESLLGWPNLFT